jgi:hypothetical protein
VKRIVRGERAATSVARVGRPEKKKTDRLYADNETGEEMAKQRDKT